MKARPEPAPPAEPTPELQFREVVYLILSGNAYKIGHSKSIEQRLPALAIQLPDKCELLHSIKTDDPAGIESLLAWSV